MPPLPLQRRYHMDKEVFTAHEAAIFLNVCDTVMYRLLRSQAVHGRKVGKTWRVRKSDLLDYFDSSCDNELKQSHAGAM